MRTFLRILLLSSILIGASGAFAAIIGPDSRLSSDAFWALKTNEVAPLCSPSNVNSSGKIFCSVSVKDSSGAISTSQSKATAQIVLEKGTVLTVAHLFINENGSPRLGLRDCYFVPFFQPEVHVNLNLKSLRLLPSDFNISPDQFWKYDVALVKLESAIGEHPYPIAATPTSGTKGILIALDSIVPCAFELDPGMQECEVKTVVRDVSLPTQILYTDCDMMDIKGTQGGGPSGAGFLVLQEGQLKVAGVLRGEYHSLPNGSPYDRTQNSTVFVGFSPDILKWLNEK